MKKIKVVGGYAFEPYQHEDNTDEQSLKQSKEFLSIMTKRRSIRDFSRRSVSEDVIKNIIITASTAPSGAHKQPWTFCVVSDPEIKKKIREAAEQEEYESYHNRMSAEWIEAIRPLQTDWHKPFLEDAPYLIIVFKKIFDVSPAGKKSNNYYVNESVGIATGILLTAIHLAGLVALTHTPNPMNFLSKILKRPENERPYLLIPVGYPAEEAYVPQLIRKPLENMSVWYS